MIEHVAKAVFPSDYYVSPEVVTELVSAHVDAILDYLQANADEWAEWGAILEDEADEPTIVSKGLIAALRIQKNQP
jgi:hypothetical protein